MFHNYVVLLIIWQNLYLQHLQLSLGVTGDVMTRDSQASAGYWEIVQDMLNFSRLPLGIFLRMALHVR